MLSFIGLVILVSLVCLIMASLFDLKTGEIPEKVNYGFVLAVLALSALDSYSTGDASLFLSTLMPGAAFFILGFVLFYFGQWGGGDVKLMAGIGCSMGYLAYAGSLPSGFVFPFYVTYFVNMGFIAFPYVVAYGLMLGIRNKSTWKEFIGYFCDNKTRLLLVVSLIPSLVAVYFNIYPMAILYLMIPPMLVSALYLKAVEKTALQEEIPVSNLREGDVVAEDLFSGEERIASKRDIEGFSKEEIAGLQKLVTEGRIPANVTIKRGIKFAPVLFLTYVTVICFGNFMELAFRALI